MINLTDYTPRKRQYLKATGRFCIYVIGPDSANPSMVGTTCDISDRVYKLQQGNWKTLFLHYVGWCPGSPVASEIERLSHELLKKVGKWRFGSWFDVPAEWAKRTIETVAVNRYPGNIITSHEDMIEKLKEKPIDRADHIHTRPRRGLGFMPQDVT